MSDQPPAPPRKDPREVAAEAKVTAAAAQARERRARARAEYEERTRSLLFVKEFQATNAAVMQDPFETVGARYMAWVRRYSWGEWSLFAIGIDGHPKYQVDAAGELGVSAQAISKAHNYAEARGYLEKQPKLIVPVIDPVLSGPAPDGDNSPEWGAFVEFWKVAHSTEFDQLEVARSVVTKIRKVRLSEYKKWREQEKATRASLYGDAIDIPGERLDPKLLTPFQRDTDRKEVLRSASRQPVDGGMQFQGRAFLFAEILRLQKQYPGTSFAAAEINPLLPEHQRLMDILIDILGADQDELTGFVVTVVSNFKGLGGNAAMRRVRAPGTSSGPEGLGLLVEWAKDYVRLMHGGNAARNSGKGEKP